MNINTPLFNARNSLSKGVNTNERELSSMISSTEFEKATYRKVTLRLMPFLFLCYTFSYISRVNVGFAKLQMQTDLRYFTDTVYGIGAGIFFIGYFLFEVPSNMIMRRIGARALIAPVMIIWGLLSASTMFAYTSTTFYILRFTLGIIESGFFPGVILYLTFWYTAKHRAKMTGYFMSAMALSSAFGGAVSGWILQEMTTSGSLRAWQWLFMIEALPAIFAGFSAYFVLSDKPSEAMWLTQDEKDLLSRRLDEEEAAKAAKGVTQHKFSDAFRSKKVWAFCFVYLGIISGNYGLTFWLPQIIKDNITTNYWYIGLVSMVPWGISAIAMIWYGHHSDQTGERRWHLAVAALLSAAGFAVAAIPRLSPVESIAAITVAAIGFMSTFSCFWAIPAEILSGAAAAAGIAWINSIGNLGGYLAPSMIGKLRDMTGNRMTIPFLVLSFLCLAASVVVLYVTRRRPVPAD